MIRYSVLIISAVLAITTAASAQITFSIGGSRNNDRYSQNYYPEEQGYCQDEYDDYGRYDYGPPPGHYYCQTHNEYCNHGQNYGQRDNRRYRKRQRRQARRANRYNRNQCPPPGHYYCRSHNSYCSH